MHKSYYSVKPCVNRYLQREWDMKYYGEHLQKIADAKPMVNTRAPKTYVHLHLKLRKIRLEEERLFLIERDNRILLEKMSHIMRTRGRLDNVNNYVPKSLNREKRQRELLRVALENQEIITRIMCRKTEYDQSVWRRDWQQNLEYMENISHFPENWWKQGDQKSARSSPQSKKRKDDEYSDSFEASDTENKKDTKADDKKKEDKDKKKEEEKRKKEENEKKKKEEEEERKKEESEKKKRKEEEDRKKAEEEEKRKEEEERRKEEEKRKKEEEEERRKEEEERKKEEEERRKEEEERKKVEEEERRKEEEERKREESTEEA